MDTIENMVTVEVTLPWVFSQLGILLVDHNALLEAGWSFVICVIVEGISLEALQPVIVVRTF